MGRLKNSPQAISSTFSNSRTKIGTWTTKGKEVYMQVIKHLPVMRGDFGEISVWRWITLSILFILSIITVMGYLALQWVKTNGPKLVKFDSLENWELQAAAGLFLFMVFIAYVTRKKKPPVVADSTQPTPVTAVQANVVLAPLPPKKEEVVKDDSLSGWAFLGILLMFVFLHALGYYALGQWWIDNIWNNPASLIVHLILAIAVLNLPKGKVPKNQQMARFAIVVVLFVFLPYQACSNAGLMRGSSSRASTGTSGQNVFARNTASITPLTAATIGMEEKPCLEDKGLKGLNVKLITETLWEYPALLAIACRESGLNHMDPENPKQVLLGRADKRDQGFLQINSFYHPPATVEKEVGCKDLKDFTCSEKYGKKLYDKSGLNPWYPWGTKNESGRQYPPLTVPVTAGEDFGPRINIPRLAQETRFDHPGHQIVVEAEAADGSKKEYTLTHGNYQNMGYVIWLRAKRAPGEKENVKLKITYAFQQCPIIY